MDLTVTRGSGNEVLVEVTPTQSVAVTIDRGIAGVGIQSISIFYVPPDEYYLDFLYTDGTNELVQLPAIAAGVSSFNTRVGAVTLNATDVLNALGYTPVDGPATATDNAIARFDGTSGDVIQNSAVSIDDTGRMTGILSEQFADGAGTVVQAGLLWYDNANGSWNAGMGGGNITQQIGEELYRYGKASSAINDSPLQLVYKTGTVGGSGVITFAPTVAGITDADSILGCATENIPLNGFGRITTYGVVHNITTNGSAYGETWADNDDLYYNPVTGGLTKFLPASPGLKLFVGTVIKAGSGGSGSFIVRFGTAKALSELDNVTVTAPTEKQILAYDSSGQYWKNYSFDSFTFSALTKTSAYTLTANDSVIFADATSAPFSVTLPSAVGLAGKNYIVKRTNAGANSVTIATTSSQTIDGQISYVLSVQYAAISVMSNGSEWLIIERLSARNGTNGTF